MLYILSILAVTTLHDLAKSCKKLGKIRMLHILSILVLNLTSMILPNLVRNLARFICYRSCQFLPWLPCIILPNTVSTLARFMLHILSILALITLHDLAKSCKKLGKFHMLQILSILALITLHDLAKSCKKLGKIHMLQIFVNSCLNYLAIWSCQIL